MNVFCGLEVSLASGDVSTITTNRPSGNRATSLGLSFSSKFDGIKTLFDGRISTLCKKNVVIMGFCNIYILKWTWFFFVLKLNTVVIDKKVSFKCIVNWLFPTEYSMYNVEDTPDRWIKITRSFNDFVKGQKKLWSRHSPKLNRFSGYK